MTQQQGAGPYWSCSACSGSAQVVARLWTCSPQPVMPRHRATVYARLRTKHSTRRPSCLGVQLTYGCVCNICVMSSMCAHFLEQILFEKLVMDGAVVMWSTPRRRTLRRNRMTCSASVLSTSFGQPPSRCCIDRFSKTTAVVLTCARSARIPAVGEATLRRTSCSEKLGTA